MEKRKHTAKVSDDWHRKRYSEAVREARLAGDKEFQSWFNKSKSIHQTIVRGYWDLTFHILRPKVCECMEKPEEKVALEIGYGGGRILNAACSYFKQVFGIDIHDQQEKVETFLRSQGKSNFKLIKTLGRTIGVESETIDFIYSFIVLQHLPSFSVYESYIKETYRCLKTGGVAQLYFGKYDKLSLIDRSRFFIPGYKEITNARPNYTSLVIRVPKAKKLCKKVGFKIIDVGTSYKRAPDGYPKIRGEQNYVTLLKPSKR